MILQANALKIPLADKSIHCCITSPPYWLLRDYSTNGQLGLESTIKEYIENMVLVFREVWRVMRDDAVLWLNLGDSYASAAGGYDASGSRGTSAKISANTQAAVLKNGTRMPPAGLKAKDLCMMPARLAMALQADGWWLRSMMPWIKRSSMPESVTDRPASALEYVFLLTKSGTSQYWTNPRLGGTRQQPKPDYIWKHKETGEQVDIDPHDENYNRINLWQGHDYFFDMDAIRKEHVDFKRGAFGASVGSKDERQQPGVRTGTMNNIDRNGAKREYHPSGRNFRNTDLFYQSLEEPHGMIFSGDEMVGLDVNPYAYKESHFATFPPKLIVPLIKAGTSEKGCCVECGAPWERVVEKKYQGSTDRADHEKYNGKDAGMGTNPGIGRSEVTSKTIGWKPTCKHKAETKPCVVFDPFGGSGTVKDVAERLGRKAIVMDLSYEYCQLAKKRCCSDQVGLDLA